MVSEKLRLNILRYSLKKTDFQTSKKQPVRAVFVMEKIFFIYVGGSRKQNQTANMETACFSCFFIQKDLVIRPSD